MANSQQQYDNQYTDPNRPDPGLNNNDRRTLFWWAVTAVIVVAALAYGAFQYRSGYVNAAAEVGATRVTGAEEGHNARYLNNDTSERETTTTVPAGNANSMGINPSAGGTPADSGTPATSSPAPEATPAPPSTPGATSTPAATTSSGGSAP